MTETTTGWRLVTESATLAVAARAWGDAGVVAVDTEFVRERTFYPALGLVQLFDGRTAWLVDPLAIADLEPLADLLADRAILKVFHAPSEDLEVFHHRLGVLPEPLFDTQTAAALAGFGPAPSYQSLAASLAGTELPKAHTRTNWLERPLAPEQLAYVADDVIHLLGVHRQIAERLRELGRLTWAEEDSAALLDPSRFALDPREAYLRLRGLARLQPRQLSAARDLAAWREREARRRDLPRGFVLRDDFLLAIARALPDRRSDLFSLPGADPRQARRDGEAWIEIVAAASAAAAPPPHRGSRPTRAERSLQDRLRRRVAERARQLGIEPSLLATRRSLSALARGVPEGAEPQLPPALDGWRRAVIGEELLAEARRRG